MAINPKAQYPGQTITGDPGYPYGKPRNVLVSGDGTGFPFEATWVQDLLGFLQALLDAAGITLDPLLPGTPDKVGASQYLDAIKYLTRHIVGTLSVQGAVAADELLSGNGSLLNSLGLANSMGPTEHSGAQTFRDGAVSLSQFTVNLGGIVIGPGGVVIGNGLDGIIILAGGFTLNAGVPSSIQDELVFSGAGRIRKRVINAADANSNFDVTTTDVLVVRSGSVTASRVYTLQNTGASVGSEIAVHNCTGFTQTIHDSGGFLIGTVPVAGSLGGRPVASVLRFSYEDDGLVGTRWVLLS